MEFSLKIFIRRIGKRLMQKSKVLTYLYSLDFLLLWQGIDRPFTKNSFGQKLLTKILILEIRFSLILHFLRIVHKESYSREADKTLSKYTSRVIPTSIKQSFLQMILSLKRTMTPFPPSKKRKSPWSKESAILGILALSTQ